METITHHTNKRPLAMRNYALLLGLILGICTSVFGEAPPVEQWVARYTGPGNSTDHPYALVVDNLGNVYVTGSSYDSDTSNDYATIKYDSEGNQQWVARYNGPGNSSDTAYSLAVDNLGNVYVTGFSAGSGTSWDYATVKYGPNGGDPLWVARYNGTGNGDDRARALAIDDSGNVYVTGRSTGSGTGNDYTTIKYGPNGGDPLWVARYNGPGNLWDEAFALAIDSSGNVYVTGESDGGTSYDYATVKYSPDGDRLWVARYNGPGDSGDNAYDLAVDSLDNSVYVTGESAGADTYWDYATVKYNTSGNQLWVARYNGPGNSGDNAYDLAVDDGGNVYVTGESDGGTSYDYATVKYNTNGNQLWAARYNGPANNNDIASALTVDNLGNVYVTGYSIGSSTSSDYATVKYDTSGNQLWIARYNGPGNDLEQSQALAVDNSGNVYVTGFSRSSETFDDYATIKYTQELPIYVDASATGANNGTSWFDAYKYLQDALTAAGSGDSIWVAQGTYRPDENSVYPDGNNSRYATFQLKSNVAIYGGFPSGGGSRDSNTYKTTLSGDLADNDDYEYNPGDLFTEPTRAENSYHVATGSYTDATAILDGFTITAGNANAGGWPNGHGGGMFNTYANCMVNKCTFVENSSRYGGGMAGNTSHDLHVSNCTFLRNEAKYNGGGMDLYLSNHAVVTNCTFSGNVGIIDGAGGMSIVESESPTLTNCTFSGNSALNGGSGGIWDLNSSPMLTNCILWGNTGPTGAQIYNSGTTSSPTVRYCDVQGGWTGTGNIDVNPCFVNSSAGDLHLLSGSPCIDAGDNGAVPAGITTDIDGDPRFADDTCTDDTGNGSPPIVDMGIDEFLRVRETVGEGETVTLNPGGGSGDPTEDALVIFENISTSAGNVTVTQMASDLHPEQTSFSLMGTTLIIETTLEAGQFLMTVVIPFTAAELYGQDWQLLDLKYWDGSGWQTAGTGPRYIDTPPLPSLENLKSRGLGAYGVYWDSTEGRGFVWANVNHITDFAAALLVGDFEPDGDVDLVDFAKFALNWLDTDCGVCGRADLTGDGNVDYYDLKKLCDNWLEGK